jgi:hypothetical protein
METKLMVNRQVVPSELLDLGLLIPTPKRHCFRSAVAIADKGNASDSTCFEAVGRPSSLGSSVQSGEGSGAGIGPGMHTNASFELRWSKFDRSFGALFRSNRLLLLLCSEAMCENIFQRRPGHNGA